MKGTDITAAHLGRRFRISLRGGALVEGILDWYRQKAQIIEETRLCEQNATYVAGEVTTTVHLHGVYEEFDLGPHHEITLMN